MSELSGRVKVFDENTLEYDQWFDQNDWIYQSEILALHQAIPENKTGIEIGVGTGRFSLPFKIGYGVEPSCPMAELAEERGIKIYRAYAENLPLPDALFDFALMVTTVCFLKDVRKSFCEIYRILKDDGVIILGIIDKESDLGRKYEKKKEFNKYYREATFYSTQELTAILNESGFQQFEYWQTLFPDIENSINEPEVGFGKGGFVVIKAQKEIKN